MYRLIALEDIISAQVLTKGVTTEWASVLQHRVCMLCCAFYWDTLAVHQRMKPIKTFNKSASLLRGREILTVSRTSPARNLRTTIKV